MKKSSSLKKLISLAAFTVVAYAAVVDITTTYIEIQAFGPWCLLPGFICG